MSAQTDTMSAQTAASKANKLVSTACKEASKESKGGGCAAGVAVLKKASAASREFCNDASVAVLMASANFSVAAGKFSAAPTSHGAVVSTKALYDVLKAVWGLVGSGNVAAPNGQGDRIRLWFFDAPHWTGDELRRGFRGSPNVAVASVLDKVRAADATKDLGDVLQVQLACILSHAGMFYEEFLTLASVREEGLAAALGAGGSDGEAPDADEDDVEEQDGETKANTGDGVDRDGGDAENSGKEEGVGAKDDTRGSDSPQDRGGNTDVNDGKAATPATHTGLQQALLAVANAHLRAAARGRVNVTFVDENTLLIGGLELSFGTHTGDLVLPSPSLFTCAAAAAAAPAEQQQQQQHVAAGGGVVLGTVSEHGLRQIAGVCAKFNSMHSAVLNMGRPFAVEAAAAVGLSAPTSADPAGADAS